VEVQEPRLRRLRDPDRVPDHGVRLHERERHPAAGPGAPVVLAPWACDLLKARHEKAGTTEGVFSRFPSSKALDDLVYRAIIWGFPFLTAGIITGAAWANYAWGTYWSWDPKETWSLIVWLVYAAFLHARVTRGWHGTRAAVLSIVGFAATVFCYLGVNLVLSGLHSYGG
jgi:cytochrome c-type biogenesis protein CcsB